MIKNYRLNNKYKIINIFAKTTKQWTHLQNTHRKIKLKTVQNVLFNILILYSLARICSAHFEDDCYVNLMIETYLNYSPRCKRKLKETAIPTIHVHSPPK